MFDKDSPSYRHLVNAVQACAVVAELILLLIACFIIFMIIPSNKEHPGNQATANLAGTSTPLWKAPDSASVSKDENGALIAYGRELISHTARYLGPSGKVMSISNGMNCQNCHLRAGTKPFGNNYSAVSATYPKFRARSGSIESIEKRVNDCIERSLNGKALDHDSREMRAIVSYMHWLGKDVAKGKAPEGAGIWDLPVLDRPADPVQGAVIYEQRCNVCHGKNGEGVRDSTITEWKYPPLWGENSYTKAAGLFRLSRLAGYVKANMPFETFYDAPVLTDEEAWDVAAYVNSMPRPSGDISHDWPDISLKPFDHPFGPYADPFSEQQHKYGPFKPIKKVQSNLKK